MLDSLLNLVTHMSFCPFPARVPIPVKCRITTGAIVYKRIRVCGVDLLVCCDAVFICMLRVVCNGVVFARLLWQCWSVGCRCFGLYICSLAMTWRAARGVCSGVDGGRRMDLMNGIENPIILRWYTCLRAAF